MTKIRGIVKILILINEVAPSTIPRLRDDPVFREDAAPTAKEKLGEASRKERGDEGSEAQSFEVPEGKPRGDARAGDDHDVGARSQVSEGTPEAAHDGENRPFDGEDDEAGEDEGRDAEAHDGGAPPRLR